MFPNTFALDRVIGEMRSRGYTPKNSSDLRTLLIARTCSYFPGKGKAALAEEYLVERGIIPAKQQKNKS